MHHDEFMRRTLELTKIADDRKRSLAAVGQAYLTKVRAMDDDSRAMALASYEDGGLEKVFRAILTAPHWNDPALQAFSHFLSEHIRFDSDPEQGHGALCRHLTPDERVMPLWAEFKEMLIETAPRLAHSHRVPLDANVTNTTIRAAAAAAARALIELRSRRPSLAQTLAACRAHCRFDAPTISRVGKPLESRASVALAMPIAKACSRLKARSCVPACRHRLKCARQRGSPGLSAGSATPSPISPSSICRR